MTNQPDPVHPASSETAPHTRTVAAQHQTLIRQLIKLHGARALVLAIADISQAEGDAIARANVKDATAPFAHRANATVLRSIVRRLYS